jgi:hypothetical protein
VREHAIVVVTYPKQLCSPTATPLTSLGYSVPLITHFAFFVIERVEMRRPDFVTLVAFLVLLLVGRHFQVIVGMRACHYRVASVDAPFPEAICFVHVYTEPAVFPMPLVLVMYNPIFVLLRVVKIPLVLVGYGSIFGPQVAL